jgi:hypothetical protein
VVFEVSTPPNVNSPLAPELLLVDGAKKMPIDSAEMLYRMIINEIQDEANCRLTYVPCENKLSVTVGTVEVLETVSEITH